MAKPTAVTGVIDFMRFKYLYFALSLMVIIPGLVSLIVFGLKPAIDFTGGSLIELKQPQGVTLTQDLVNQSMPEGIDIASFQQTDQNSVVIRTKPITAAQNEAFKIALASNSGILNLESATQSGFLQSPIDELRFETVGPTLGKELLQKTIFAILIASVAIMSYVAYRFKELKYGLSAIIAMFHDTFILIGVFSILGHFYDVEVDTLFVTAVLTTLSFSVHDTIVVYDRIRESLRTNPRIPYLTLVNKAVTETLSRSINNSMTIIFMLLSLWLLGGDTTKWFVFALLVGTIAGTYSSTFTAAPILIVWEQISAYRKQKSK